VEGRIHSALGLYAYALLGLFLVVAPWTAVWEQAVRTLAPGPLDPWLRGGWARGTVSAIGVLDLFAALKFGAELWGRGPSA